MSEEIWVDFPPEPRIKVSSLGRLMVRNNRISVGSKSSNGYMMIKVKVDGKMKAYLVHRMVMIAFHGESKLHVNHKNGLKHDNRLANLEYVTRLQNMRHSWEIGLRKRTPSEESSNASLTNKQVIEIRKLISKGIGGSEIARRFGVKPYVISKIKLGITWKNIG